VAVNKVSAIPSFWMAFATAEPIFGNDLADCSTRWMMLLCKAKMFNVFVG
jgi:hypothetical protein